MSLGSRRVMFFFTPQPQPFPFSYLRSPLYTAEPGIFGGLTGNGCTVLFTTNQGFSCFPDTVAYDPTEYTYTDPFGRVFTFDAAGPLKSVQDLSGNLLTITPAGIISSAGNTTVAFVRDSEGRITQITDPEGNSYNYAYDAAGDLVGVSLPGIATPVQYGYDATHLLTQETDPRGEFGRERVFLERTLEEHHESGG